jgi:hypothetical protein
MPVNLLSLASKQDTLTFPAGDGEINIEYDPNKLTKSFRAEVVRLDRDLSKAERRLQHLFQIAILVQAPDGSIEAQAEDEEAEKAIQQMIQLDDILKRQMDTAILSIVDKWDLIVPNPKHAEWVKAGGEGKEPPKGIVVPLTEEGIWPVPVTFEAEILMRLVQGSPTGEAPGLNSSNNSQPTSKPKARTRSSARLPNKKLSSKAVKLVHR